MSESKSLDVSELRGLVQDLFRPQPWIYWCDFLFCLAVGYGCATAYTDMSGLTLIRSGCFIVAGLALYRVALIMHEIVHFRKNELLGFRITWNLIAGVPMLTPSIFYESHLSHHNTNDYGTVNDGEYLPLAKGPLREILFFLGQVFLQPIVIVLRFALLTPISFLHPRLRRWTLEHASSFVINVRHRRKDLQNGVPWHWTIMEVLCSLRAMTMFAAVGLGLTHWTRIPLLYALAVFILTLNQLRTLAAHRYRSDGQKLSHADQFFDSVIINGMPVITELWCPVGLRYHALHHLFPSIPYHNLGIAHRRLMEHLPADSVYRDVVFPSFWSAVRQLLADARRHARRDGSSGVGEAA